ncbi:hypothetical protein JQ584_45395 [Bradyrhizobium liaoningense]|nr:hypothetical protein [Bradyrhizobium liaoningense]
MLPLQNVIALRRHTTFARGFSPHRDDLPSAPKRIAVLWYLSREWTPESGGLLQFGTQTRLPMSSPEPLRWKHWLGRRLDQVSLGGPGDKPIVSLRLVDVLPPLNSRAVLLALHPLSHS